MNFTYAKLSFSRSKIILHLKEVHRTQDSSFSGSSEVPRDMWGKQEWIPSAVVPFGVLESVKAEAKNSEAIYVANWGNR